MFASGTLIPALPASAATSKLARLVQTAGKKKAKPRTATTRTISKTATAKTLTATADKRKKDVPRVATAVSLPSFAPISSLAVEPQPALPPMVVKPVKPIAAPLPARAPAPAPAPAVVPADGLPDMPDDQAVLDVIRQNVAGVRACYLRLQRAGVQASGKAMVSFLVSGEGHATELQVEAPSFAGTTLPSCVTQQISRWVFPRSHKGIGPISYPFVFVGS